MKNKKFIALTLLMITFLIGVIYIYSISGSEGVDVHSDKYVEKYFNRDKVMDVNIEIDEKELKEMFANAQSEESKMASVTINGDTYKNIAVRPKGNSSLKAVASSSTKDKENSTENKTSESKNSSTQTKGEDRFSLKIDFDEYVSGQTMEGLTQLNLNNNYSDPSYMREFISYSICEDMGLKTPEMAYAKVSINGKYHGLYLAVESILEPFIENSFETISGDLYKSTGAQGGTLKYNGDDFKNYSSMEVKSDRKNADYTKFTNMLKALESGKDIEKYLDVDSALKYIALNTALLNLDSYQGSFAHNYYLYEENGKFTVIPWDLNMAFGGFNGGKGSGQLIYIDEPTTGNVEDRPLVSNLLSNEKYKEKYHKYLNEIVEKYLDSDYLTTMTNQLHSLIATYVKEDPTAFYTYKEFETNIKSQIADASEGMGNKQASNIKTQDNNTKIQDKQNNLQNKENNNQKEIKEAKDNMAMGKILPGILDLSKTMSKTIKYQLSGVVSSTKDKNETETQNNKEQMPQDMQKQEGMERPPQGMEMENMPQPPQGMDMGKPTINQNGEFKPNDQNVKGENQGENMMSKKGTTDYSKYIISLVAVVSMSLVIVLVSLFKRRRIIKVKR